MRTVILACSSLKDYVEGSNHLLEKLIGGNRDEQFLIAEEGHLIRHADFF